MFIIEESSSWNPNLRSKAAIRTSPVRYFTDPSIATASLKIGPDDLINDLKTFGYIFKTLAIRDLRIYTDAIKGDVFHYRDSDGTECDAVIHVRDGKYGLCEIKLGGTSAIMNAKNSLLKLEKKINSEETGAPSFKMVLTGVGDYAYRDEDGIYIVPIGTLKN